MLNVLSLGGQRAQLCGIEMSFERKPDGRTAAWKGGEGYACRVRVGDFDYVLKWHFSPSRERRMRTAFLAKLDLPSIEGFQVYWGAPCLPVNGRLELETGGDSEEVDGYLCRYVQGEELDRIRTAALRGSRADADWSPTLGQRVELARQLCLAIEGLESVGLAHCDLSPANIMVARQTSSNLSPQLRLIDFDGFHHAAVPPIPPSRERGGRPKGTPGYQAPAFKPRDAIPNSDRLALGILVVELIVLEDGDWEMLGRDEPTLLSQKMLNDRTYDLPSDVVGRWPEGFALLRDAVSQAHPANAPGPSDWRRVVDRIPVQEATGGHSTIRPYRARHLTVTENGISRQVALTKAHGGLGVIDPTFAWAAFRDSEGILTITGEAPKYVFVRRGGGASNPVRHVGPVELTLQAGDNITLVSMGRRVEVRVGQNDA